MIKSHHKSKIKKRVRFSRLPRKTQDLPKKTQDLPKKTKDVSKNTDDVSKSHKRKSRNKEDRQTELKKYLRMMIDNDKDVYGVWINQKTGKTNRLGLDDYQIYEQMKKERNSN